ncbi:MAG: hypothetical protein WAL41_07555 [Mycobacterium sp.]
MTPLGSRMTLLMVVAFASVAPGTRAQFALNERAFHAPRSTVEKALKELQPAMSGRLPVLEGFVLPGDHPLNNYQRAYYQSHVEVSSTAPGDSVVRVSTKVTAWYADSAPSHSGYRLLTSNGRLESDLLDQLADLLASRLTQEKLNNNSREMSKQDSTKNSQVDSSVPDLPTAPARQPTAGIKGAEPSISTPTISTATISTATISAPAPQSPERSPEVGPGFASPLQQRSSDHLADAKNSQIPSAQASLQAEAASLEEVLKNQARPKNLVAVKKSGTPVVAAPSLTAKTLFMASAHDEFEMLDFGADWVHVKISGLSRGWIWRTSLEMPEGISDVPLVNEHGKPVAADLFQITREETAPFPGDWNPLRGRNVRIISVQKIQENEANSGAEAKLEYAKSLLDKNYSVLAAKSPELSGIVLIFDSIDGGMIAATSTTVRQWKAGTLSDAGLWHQCYFDPPETFSVSSPTGGH